jgi:hypothetical protein
MANVVANDPATQGAPDKPADLTGGAAPGGAATPTAAAEVQQVANSAADIPDNGPVPGVTYGRGTRKLPALSGLDQAVFGPTDKPALPLPNGAVQGRVPQSVIEGIPALIQASKSPDAPPALRALIQLLDHSING